MSCTSDAKSKMIESRSERERKDGCNVMVRVCKLFNHATGIYRTGL